MRYANFIPVSHIARSADPRVTADTRRAFITTKAAVVALTETAKRFAATVAPLVNRDGSFDRSAIMHAATRAAQARMEVTGDAGRVHVLRTQGRLGRRQSFPPLPRALRAGPMPRTAAKRQSAPKPDPALYADILAALTRVRDLGETVTVHGMTISWPKQQPSSYARRRRQTRTLRPRPRLP
ncbi:hypothetical protein, partial [Methylobacterium sp. WL6]|uniref:hypothetical protein n=1 Tax=Methylobacterium sp. WL6 TaxID=2603901 RepID=UPI0011CA97B9